MSDPRWTYHDFLWLVVLLTTIYHTIRKTEEVVCYVVYTDN